MEFSEEFKLWWMENTRLMFRVKGTVILKIWPQVLFGVLLSTGVVACHNYVPGMDVDYPLTLVPVLGFVISLLLVFRTNTAYDRYYEGRRIWSTMTQAIRMQTRCFWIGVKDHTGTSKDIIEKTTAINLLVAFAFATKNYLREEYSYEADEEIRQLVSNIPKFQSMPDPSKGQKHPSNGQNGNHVTLEMSAESSDNQRSKGHRKGTKKAKSRTVPKTMSSRRRSAYRVRKSVNGKESFIRRDFMFQAHDYFKPTNIPLQLAYYLDAYTYLFWSRKSMESETFKMSLAATTSLLDALTQFERILRTPIPLAYSVHLHHSVWLYMVSLPFQLVGTLGWVTIPAIGLVTFALQGILAIGWEIENPFGYDDNDLPLDDFCDVIRQEAEMIMSHKVPATETWTFTEDNHPFYPKSFDSSLELKEKSVEELQGLLFSRHSDHSHWTSDMQS